MTLPIIVSVPHAGLSIPPDVADLNLLTTEEIRADGDEGAADIYQIADEVEGYVTTDIGRPFIDMNRAEKDFSKDGVVKTHTCWDVPVYRNLLPEKIAAELIDRYWRPYHQRLSTMARDAIVGLDLHTMAEYGPPVGPDSGKPRPFICVSDGNGTTCPAGWADSLADRLREVFDEEVTINKPFSGGYICQRHSTERPWIQIEFSRTPKLSSQIKREKLLMALNGWIALQN